jgi:hypothetical protein
MVPNRVIPFDKVLQQFCFDTKYVGKVSQRAVLQSLDLASHVITYTFCSPQESRNLAPCKCLLRGVLQMHRDNQAGRAVTAYVGRGPISGSVQGKSSAPKQGTAIEACRIEVCRSSDPR